MKPHADDSAYGVDDDLTPARRVRRRAIGRREYGRLVDRREDREGRLRRRILIRWRLGHSGPHPLRPVAELKGMSCARKNGDHRPAVVVDRNGPVGEC